MTLWVIKITFFFYSRGELYVTLYEWALKDWQIATDQICQTWRFSGQTEFQYCKILSIFVILYICKQFSTIKADQWIKALAAETPASAPHVVQGLCTKFSLGWMSPGHTWLEAVQRPSHYFGPIRGCSSFSAPPTMLLVSFWVPKESHRLTL